MTRNDYPNTFPPDLPPYARLELVVLVLAGLLIIDIAWQWFRS